MLGDSFVILVKTGKNVEGGFFGSQLISGEAAGRVPMAGIRAPLEQSFDNGSRRD